MGIGVESCFLGHRGSVVYYRWQSFRVHTLLPPLLHDTLHVAAASLLCNSILLTHHPDGSQRTSVRALGRWDCNEDDTTHRALVDGERLRTSWYDMTYVPFVNTVFLMVDSTISHAVDGKETSEQE